MTYLQIRISMVLLLVEIQYMKSVSYTHLTLPTKLEV